MPEQPGSIHLTTFPIALILITIGPQDFAGPMVMPFMKGAIISGAIGILKQSLATLLITVPSSLDLCKKIPDTCSWVDWLRIHSTSTRRPHVLRVCFWGWRLLGFTWGVRCLFSRGSRLIHSSNYCFRTGSTSMLIGRVILCSEPKSSFQRNVLACLIKFQYFLSKQLKR